MDLKVEITAAIIQDFRNSLPAFADTTKYTDTQVKEFLCNADAKTANGWGLYKTCDEQHPPPPKRWGMFYLAAHELTVINNAADDPTDVSILNSVTVGDESYSGVVKTPTSEIQAYYERTIYGLKYLAEASLIKVGYFNATSTGSPSYVKNNFYNV